ncbi:MAG: AAA family ATPase [Halioglobus sp.]
MKLSPSALSRRKYRMYEVFYNLKAEPFRLSPDHRFCFEHKSYAKARAYMAYAFKRAEGFVMITGRPGTGKTTLIGDLVESLSRDKVFTANLVCTQLQADDLLKTVAYSFGVGSARVDKAELLQRLTILLHRWHREGRRALLIVDEAQDLTPSAMEELRLLTNIQIGGQPLLQIFLLGQPELRDLILSPEMEQVHQRIVAASHIDGLEVDETEAYVIHRLVAVGWQGDPAIDRAIFPLIYRFSEGVPRRINLICSRLFLLGSVEQRHAIGVEDVGIVISELQAENLAAGTGFYPGDFAISGTTEWVPVPRSQPGRNPASHLRTASDEHVTVSGNALAEGADVGKKKENPSSESVAQASRDSDTPGSPLLVDDASSEVVASQQGLEREWAPLADADSQGLQGEVRVKAARLRSRSRLARNLGLVALFIVPACLFLVFGRNFFIADDVHVPPAAQSDDVTAGKSRDSMQLPGPAPVVPQGETSDRTAGPAPTIPTNESESPGYVQTSVNTNEGDGTPGVDTVVPDVAVAPQTVDQHDVNQVASTTLSPPDDIELPVTSTSAPGEHEQTFLVNFTFDSDVLLPDSHDALDGAVKRLLEQPDSVAAITGFTDSRGDERYNLSLSRKRATAVEQYLIAAGVDRQRLHVEGRGVLAAPLAERASGDELDNEPQRVVQIKLSDINSQ